jgi:hypothetical protein
MLQFSPDLLNRNVAPGIAEFTTAEIPDLRPEFPQAEHWLSNHYLNTLLGPNYAGTFRKNAINMLCRAQAEFALFHQAREATLDYLQNSTLHNPSVRRYYAAIALWESCLLNYQIFLDLYVKATGKQAFTKGDGSEEQRAYDIATKIKHWGSFVNSPSRDDDYTIPMWLSNQGLHSHGLALSYSEFTAVTREVANAAHELQNPGAAAAST